MISTFVEKAKARHLECVSSDSTAIQSILIPNISNLLEIQKKLLEKNIYVAVIRPPTVPKGSSRIRISLNINHTKEDTVTLLDSLYEGLK